MVKDKEPVTASNQKANVVADELKWTDMPKTHNNLYSRIIDFDNLWQAYLAARKGKRYRREVSRFAVNLEDNLLNIHNHLIWESWQPGKSREFRIYEPKQRDIQAPPFADRIVHHALVRIVEPLFEKRFIYHSYACRRDKGAQKAIRAVQSMLRQAQRESDNPYVIKADVKSYFASINHDILFSAVRRVISCPQTLALWRRISSAYGHEDGIGLPVGALTSQLSANILLDQLDHAVKDRMGINNYVRYMDDIIIVVLDKASAWLILNDLIREMSGLGLCLNPKTSIFPIERGVDFCGYRTWATHILPRKRNIKKARERLRVIARHYREGGSSISDASKAVSGLLAYTKHCDARCTVCHILDDFILRR
jgi:retron-type reverse transcriptase